MLQVGALGGPRPPAPPTAQALLRAGALDELEIHLIPVLLGQGRRLVERLGPDHVELELTRTLPPA